MKTILISIKPKYAEQIMNGKKTIEVRKFSIEPPFKVVNYVTKGYPLFAPHINIGHFYTLQTIDGKPSKPPYEHPVLNGKVTFEYVVNKVDKYPFYKDLYNKMYFITFGEFEQACLTQKEIREYGKGKTLYGWYISDLKIYNKPKELGEFYVYNKELEKRFIDGDGFCCYDGKDENGEPLNDCSADNIKRCYQCWEEWSGWCKRVIRPPQNFVYVEEI